MESNWISVKDRLPESKGFYLGVSELYKTYKVEVCEVFETLGSVDGELAMVLKFQDYITHWMPLPKPPQP